MIKRLFFIYNRTTQNTRPNLLGRTDRQLGFPKTGQHSHNIRSAVRLKHAIRLAMFGGRAERSRYSNSLRVRGSNPGGVEILRILLDQP